MNRQTRWVLTVMALAVLAALFPPLPDESVWVATLDGVAPASVAGSRYQP